MKKGFDFTLMVAGEPSETVTEISTSVKVGMNDFRFSSTETGSYPSSSIVALVYYLA